MIRPPPRSPLFPHPALSRPRGPAGERQVHRVARDLVGPQVLVVAARQLGQRDRRVDVVERRAAAGLDRKSTRLNSKSRQYLVCRLLLEKKKKNIVKTRDMAL